MKTLCLLAFLLAADCISFAQPASGCRTVTYPEKHPYVHVVSVCTAPDGTRSLQWDVAVVNGNMLTGVKIQPYTYVLTKDKAVFTSPHDKVITSSPADLKFSPLEDGYYAIQIQDLGSFKKADIVLAVHDGKSKLCGNCYAPHTWLDKSKSTQIKSQFDDLINAPKNFDAVYDRLSAEAK